MRYPTIHTQCHIISENFNEILVRKYKLQIIKDEGSGRITVTNVLIGIKMDEVFNYTYPLPYYWRKF